MDGNRFDALVKTLIAGTNRRRTLSALLGGTLGLLGLADPDEVWSAKSGKCKQECDPLCEFCKEGRCRTKKKRNGKKVKVCKRGKCKPKSNETRCAAPAGGICQNGACACPNGTEACGGGSGVCVPLCAPGAQARNQDTCTCCFVNNLPCTNTSDPRAPQANASCCSNVCLPVGGSGSTSGVCAPGGTGTPCDVDANCASGNCVNGRCAA
jgi:hypothetical protein